MKLLFKEIVFGILAFFITSTANAESAKVLRSSGIVLIDGKPLVGKFIPSGSIVDVSSPGAFVDLSIHNKSFHRLKGGSSKLEFSKDSNQASIDLRDGDLFSFLKPKSHQSLKVNTKSVAMGVRGTKFYVHETKEKSYLCVCEGEVQVEKLDGKSKAGTIVKAGFDLDVGPDSTVLESKQATEQMKSMSKDGFKDLGFPVK